MSWQLWIPTVLIFAWILFFVWGASPPGTKGSFLVILGDLMRCPGINPGSAIHDTYSAFCVVLLLLPLSLNVKQIYKWNINKKSQVLLTGYTLIKIRINLWYILFYINTFFKMTIHGGQGDSAGFVVFSSYVVNPVQSGTPKHHQEWPPNPKQKHYNFYYYGAK